MTERAKLARTLEVLPIVRFILAGEFAYPEGGAPARRLKNLAYGLLAAGQRVQLLAMAVPNGRAEFQMVQASARGREEVHAWITKESVGNKSTRFDWLLRNYWGAFRIWIWLARRYDLREGDVLFLYGRSFLRLAPLAWLARRRGSLVVIDVTEGLERFHGLGGKWSPVYWDWWLGTRQLPRQADFVTTISSGLAHRCVALGAKNVHILPGLESWEGNDLEKLVPIRNTKSPFRLFVFAALNAKDAPEMLLNVLLELQKRKAAVCVEIVGRYMYDNLGREWSRKLAELPGIEPWLRFHGSPEGDQLGLLLREADGFLMLRADTIAERLAFPTRLMEMLKIARPVIVSNVGDIARYLDDGRHAFILPDGNIAKIVDRIVAVIELPDRGMACGAAGYYRAAKCFDRVTRAKELIAVIDEGVGKTPRARESSTDCPCVIILTNGLRGGGAEMQMILTARELVDQSIPCLVVSLANFAMLDRYKDIVDAGRNAGLEFWTPSGPLGQIRAIGRVLKELARRRCVVWTWGYRAELWRLVVFPFARGVFSIRSASETQAYRWRWLLRLGRVFTWRYVSNSHLGVELADRVAPGIAAKARVVPNALELAFLNAANGLGSRPSVIEVLMLGNVRYAVKGYDLALLVGQKIREAELPIRLRIGGAQYAGEPNLVEEIRKKGLAEFVNWAGPISDSLGFLQSGHAFMLLSRYEGMPNALFEAMAVGLPCVATAVGDLPHYAAESNGLKVVPIEDAEAAFLEICWIWNNWDEAVAMGRRAKRFCRERFSEERMIADVMHALELTPGAETLS